MKISLRKAHALQKRIEETISNLPFTLSISIDEFDNIPEKIELQKNELLQSIQDKRDLLIAIGGIRDRVAIAGAAYYVSKNLAEIATEEGVQVSLAADIFSLEILHSDISYFGNIPLIHFEPSPAGLLPLIIKRSIDIFENL